MNIIVFGATGQVGKRVVNQALALGYKVKAFGRNIENLIDEDLRNDNFEAIKGYVFSESDVLKAIKGCDAVISCLGGAFDGNDKTRSLGMKNIVQQMSKSGVQRIIAIGGLGILNANEETLLMDTEEFPPEYLAVSQEHLEAYKHLQSSSLNWTYICPPTILDVDAKGNYHTSINYLPQPNSNKIAAGDIADCMLKAINNANWKNCRIGISSN